MARAKYQITTDQDTWSAMDWLANKLDSGFFPYDDMIDDEAFIKNIRAQEAFKETDKSPESVNTWCETYMNSEQWKQLKNAIRAARLRRERKRNYDKAVRRIDISNRALHMLQTLSKRHGVTYSELIEKYLEKDYMNTGD